jgi:hypothetical protein
MNVTGDRMKAMFIGSLPQRYADGGDGCEYTEYAVADSRQGVALQIGGWVRAKLSLPQKSACYKMLH